MMKNAIPISSYELGYMELQKSAVFNKIPQDKRGWYVEESLMIGKKIANTVLEDEETIFQLLDRHHIQLLRKKSKKIGGTLALRGEINFNKKKCVITVYEESMQSIYSGSQFSLPQEFILSKNQVLEIHLAHEYFHYLEFKTGKMVSQMLPRIQVGSFFNKKFLVEVIQCSEIAAHSFAKQFCHLDVLPNYYDFHYISQN